MKIELPFKPFTLDEVLAMTGVTGTLLDVWIREGKVLPQHGEVGGLPGLDWMQAFALFVAGRYLHENAGLERAEGVLSLIQYMERDALIGNVEMGNVICVPASMIKSLHGKMGRGTLMSMRETGGKFGRLRLDALLREFESNVRKLYPEGTKT